MPDPVRYRFHPLERRGVVVGLGPAQLATIGGAVLVALLVLRARPGGASLLGAALLVAAAVASSCWPVAGRTAVGWAPVSLRWLAVGRRRQLWRPDRDLAPPGVTVEAAPVAPGDDPLGVVHDRLAGAWSAVVAVESRSFALLDPTDKERRLAAWGAVLASAARAGSPIHRLQWVERTRSGDGDELVAHLEREAPVAPTGGPGPARTSYEDLIARAGAASQVHEVLVVVSVHPRRAGRSLRSFGRGRRAVCELLRREVRLLQGQLRTAEVQPGRPLGPEALAAGIRAGLDPTASTSTRSTAHAWPAATEETWASVRVDDRWHATYWVAEWPRVEVGADFMTPLLLAGRARTVSVTLGPVPPGRAVREAESARTADLADDELRRRAGFLDTARHRRAAEGAVAREAELANGHADYRFCGYASVSAPTPEELLSACAELEQVAQHSHLELRRLYGQQGDALTWTLPLGRGLR